MKTMANTLLDGQQLPLVFRLADRKADDCHVLQTDCTASDPLPYELKSDATGVVYHRATRLTEVGRETTDDR